MFLLHGAVFLALKTDGPMRERAGRAAAGSRRSTLVVAAAFAVWTQLAHGKTWTWAAVVVAALGTGRRRASRPGTRREGLAFLATTVVIVGAVVLLFGAVPERHAVHARTPRSA